MNDPAKAPGVKAPLLPATEVGEVFGSLAFAGKAKTVEEMDAAVADEARRGAEEANGAAASIGNAEQVHRVRNKSILG